MANRKPKPEAEVNEPMQGDVKGGTLARIDENDLTLAGRDKTEVRGETKVIDRTADEARPEPVPSRIEEMKLTHGTVLKSRVSEDA